MSYYRQQLEEWLKSRVVQAKTVYDIGGAQGNVNTRVAHWDVKDYKVLDLPDYDMNELWGDDTQKVDIVEEADIVFCLEVFEYLLNPMNAIENIAYILKKGGRAYITFAFIYPHHNELEFDSLRYTESAIKRLADFAELKIKNTWYRIDKSGMLEGFYKLDGMRAAKQYQHHNVTGFIVEFEK